jgi:hypothetical protein
MPETVDFLSPADLRDILRGMAVVTLLFERRLPPPPDHEFRIDPVSEITVGIWRDFAGNRCHCVFTPVGSLILGFDHESPMSPHATCTGPSDFRTWPGVYDSLPIGLLMIVEEHKFDPDFDYREVTFCLWNLGSGKTWTKGDITYPERDYGDPDGESYILGRIKAYHRDFVDEFRDTYRWELEKRAVAELLSGDEIERACLMRLKLACDLNSVVPEIEKMGYRVT